MKNSLGQRTKIQLGLESEEERKKRVAREKKENAKTIEYFEKLHQNKNKQIIQKTITTEQFKSEVWNVGKQYFAKRGRHFVVDDENKLFLDVICKYFTSDVQFEEMTNGELRKGLLIYGTCGTGKSSIFDIVREVIIKNDLNHLYFKNTSVHTVINEFNKESKSNEKFGGELVVEKYCRGTIHFDDLGTEKKVQAWGIKEDLLDRIIQIRYNKFKEIGRKTFVTTNKTLKELEKTYSPQVKSRLYEMFNIIPLTGEDRRF